MSTVAQYITILQKLIDEQAVEMSTRVVQYPLSLEEYRSTTGYIAGLRRAQELAQAAHDKLYGREPQKDTYENPYG